MASRGVLPRQLERWWKLLSEFGALHAGMGSFDCAAASLLRSSRFAQDDKGEVVTNWRSSTSSTLLEPVVRVAFRSLAPGCDRDFEGHGSLPGFKGTGKVYESAESPERWAVVETVPR
jgi:hypothetical protein